MGRNEMLAPGVPKYGRSKMMKMRKANQYAKKGGEKKKVEEKKVTYGKYVEADPVKVPLPSTKRSSRPTKLKKTIKPGSVLIVLSGRFMGKRVVFLKQLPSGLLLVTGPYKLNGCPIRRINQAYVIATSTTVDISGVNTDKIDDAYFARVKEAKEGEEGFFDNQEKINPEWLEKRKADQKAIDEPLLAAVSKVSLLAEYLQAPFTLSKGQAPHMMKF
ncbi:60S ribosomal protein L6 (YL16-like) [Durusdinium trenchii]|uniref:60S ribosomal protein L6 (YL16-like) n=1 Tax=Durusdinium trenchii TaxID=1381693 RepID=A0ABP0LV46_9DINO